VTPLGGLKTLRRLSSDKNSEYGLPGPGTSQIFQIPPEVFNV
jgi:hypothetical protein